MGVKCKHCNMTECAPAKMGQLYPTDISWYLFSKDPVCCKTYWKEFKHNSLNLILKNKNQRVCYLEEITSISKHILISSQMDAIFF